MNARVAIPFILALAAACALHVPAADAPGAAFTSDLAQFRKVAPELLRWTEQDPIRPGVTQPVAVAVASDGTIYAAGGRELAALDPDGKPRARRALDRDARCLAVAPDGDVIVGFADRWIACGNDLKTKVEGPELGGDAILTSVAATSNEVYAADAGALSLWRFERAGRLLGRLGDRDPARGIAGFVVPSPHFDVWAGGGEVWAANTGLQRLESYAPDGTPGRRWGEAGFAIDRFCGCCNPADFTRLPDGSFVTSEKGLPRVKVYSADGRLQSVVAPPDAFDEGVAGLDLAVDRAGRILVLDPKRGLIRTFAPRKP